MKIRLVGPELFHADGKTHEQTDNHAGRQADTHAERHDKVNSRF
jgi:hypothetical protein